MRIETIAYRVLLGALLVCLSLLTPARACDAGSAWKRDHARKLDERFAELATAASKEVANKLESQIWALWQQSGCDGVDSLMWQAQLAIQQGQHKHAIEIAGRAIRLSPRHAEAWNLRATAYFFMGEHGRSAADITQTLTLEPRHFGALAGMTTIYMRARKWGAALSTLKAALQIHPHLRDRTLVTTLEQRAKSKPP